MKKFKHLIGIFTFSILTLFLSCQKNSSINSDTKNPFTKEALSQNKDFISLNDEISRFDPNYLQTVYYDKRSLNEIASASQDLIAKIIKDPTNQGLLVKFAALYHFSSLDDLSSHSTSILSSFNALNKEFDFNKKILSNPSYKNRLEFSRAQKIYASQKYEILLSKHSNTIKSYSTGTNNYLDYIEQLELNQMLYLYNLQLEPCLDGGGGIDCKGDQCCTDRENCKLSAYNTWLDDLAIYGGGGLVGGFGLGFAGGSVGTPALGLVVGTLSGIISGTVGIAIAFNKKQNNLQICENTYKQCMAKKGG